MAANTGAKHIPNGKTNLIMLMDHIIGLCRLCRPTNAVHVDYAFYADYAYIIGL